MTHTLLKYHCHYLGRPAPELCVCIHSTAVSMRSLHILYICLYRHISAFVCPAHFFKATACCKMTIWWGYSSFSSYSAPWTFYIQEPILAFSNSVKYTVYCMITLDVCGCFLSLYIILGHLPIYKMFTNTSFFLQKVLSYFACLINTGLVIFLYVYPFSLSLIMSTCTLVGSI